MKGRYKKMLIPAKEYARINNVNLGTLRSWIHRNKIPYQKINGFNYIDSECIVPKYDKKNTTDPQYDSYSRLYNIWRMMRSRCSNRNLYYYKNYGGRGISVCDEWRNDYKAFLKWALSHG